MEHLFIYIWPHETALQLVIGVIIMLALLVTLYSVSLGIKAHKNLLMMEKLKDVAYLEGILNGTIRTQETDIFKNFEEAQGKNAATEALFEHIRAIFEAGYKSSRLDSDLLVKNTVNRIFNNADIIKTSISLFLVIGILGTLLGLAISIGSFSGTSFSLTAQSNNAAAGAELSKLFNNLRGAFAPSMWGVSMTILTVLGYTFLIQDPCINKTTENLTQLTINVWIPKLYPSVLQKSDASLSNLTKTLKNADGINRGVSELDENLKKANKTLKEISKVSENLGTAATDFKSGTASITGFQEELKQLYQQLLDNNQKFNDFIYKSVSMTGDLQTQARENFKRQAGDLEKNFTLQGAQLNKVIETLGLYDQNYATGQAQLHSDLAIAIKNFSDGAQFIQKISQELLDRGDNTVKAVGDPLQAKLKDMSLDLSKNLQGISQAVGRISDPLGRSTATIQKMFEGVGKFLEEVTENNVKAMEQQNQRILAELQRLNSTLSNWEGPALAAANPGLPATSLPGLAPGKRTVQEPVPASGTGYGTSRTMVGETVPGIGGSAGKDTGKDPFWPPTSDRSPITRPVGPVLNNKAVVEKLDEILEHMRYIDERQDNSQSEGALGMILKTVVPILVTILLIVSIGVQLTMVDKISHLEQTQNAVNEILLKGDKAAQ